MITYLTGDATEPVKKPALIMHVCNDIGAWGRGFVLALSKRWPDPERRYRGIGDHSIKGLLGCTQIVPVEGGVAVANMIAQHNVAAVHGRPPIRYEALATCLSHIAVAEPGSSVHCPRIGCGLAGGSWSVVEPLIEFYLKDREVYVYDLPGDVR